mgnify:FL=1
MKKICKITLIMLLAFLCTTFVQSYTAKAGNSYKKGNTTYFIKTKQSGHDKHGCTRYTYTMMKKKNGYTSKVCVIAKNKFGADIVHYDEGYLYVQVDQDDEHYVKSIYEIDVESQCSTKVINNFEVNQWMPKKRWAYKSYIVGKSATTAPGSFKLKVLDLDTGDVTQLGWSKVQYIKGKYLYYVDTKGLWDGEAGYTTKTQTVKIKCYNMESGKVSTLKKIKVNKYTYFSSITNKKAKYGYYVKSGKWKNVTVRFKGKN